MSKVTKYNDCRGQGLIELIVSIAVINVGILSVWSLFYTNFQVERQSEQQLVAANLAREGIEVVKNIRDTNWRLIAANKQESADPYSDIIKWNNGLEHGTYYPDYSTANLGTAKSGTGQLFINRQGFYTIDPDSASSTIFSRKIEIRDICCDSDDGIKCNNATFALSPTALQSADEYTAGCSANQVAAGLDIQSIVDWQYSGRQHSAVVEDQLYDWR